MLRMFKKHHFKSVIAALLSLVLSVSAFGGVGNVVWGDVQGVKSLKSNYLPYDEAYHGKGSTYGMAVCGISSQMSYYPNYGYANYFNDLYILGYVDKDLFPDYTVLTLGPQGGDESCMHYNLLWHYIRVEPVIMRAVCEDCGAIYADIKFDGNLSDTQYAWADLPIEIDSTIMPEVADFPTIKLYGYINGETVRTNLEQPEYTVEHIIPDDYDYSAQCPHDNIRKVYVGQTPAWAWWKLDTIKERVICNDCGLCDEYTWDMTGYEYDTSMIKYMTWPHLDIEEEDTPFIPTGEEETHDIITMVNGYASRQTWEQVRDMILSGMDPDWDDFTKALWLYCYVGTHYNYGETEYSDNDQSGIWMAVNGYGVCAAYMRLYGELTIAAGVESRLCISYAKHHGWNMIKIDGNWYYVDVTLGRRRDGMEPWQFMESVTSKFNDNLDYDLVIESYYESLYPDYKYEYCTDQTYDDSTSSLRLNFMTFNGKLANIDFNNMVWVYNDLSSVDKVSLQSGNDKSGELIAIIPDECSDALYTPAALYDGKVYSLSEEAVYEYDPDNMQEKVFLDTSDIARLLPEYADYNIMFERIRIEGDYMILTFDTFIGESLPDDPDWGRYVCSVALTEAAAASAQQGNSQSDSDASSGIGSDSSGGELSGKGDVNLDGAVDASDALCVLRAVVDLSSLTDIQKENADVNGNGSVEADDALRILKYVVGLSEF